jgi:hypothetical protein
MTNLAAPKSHTERAYALYFAKALLWAAFGAAFVGGIILEMGLDRLMVGFLAGLAFSLVIAFFNDGAKERFDRDFIRFPRQ